MASFQKLIGPDDMVIEVGGHIGYLSLYFSKLVGNGKVVVFEPGINNLPYLKQNLSNKTNVRIVEKGVGDETGKKTFYIESYTGQNNSFVKDFEGFANNKKSAGVNMRYQEVTVEIIELDKFIKEEQYPIPDFIKIDVEGFEYNVLLGMQHILSKGKSKLMVEIQASFREIYDLLKKYHYDIYDDELNRLNDYNSYLNASDNRFFIPQSDINA